MKELKSTLSEGTLTLYLEGRLDSTNEPAYASVIDSMLKKQKRTKLVLDLTSLEYISSAGLRLVLRLYKANPGMEVINVSQEVYGIFEMTGFCNILPVHRALRTVSIEGCPLIGKGAYGKVYRLDGDTIIKSYYRGNPVSDIERERELAKEAFVLGIPTAISYDVVKVKEECFGAVYEMIDADSLLDAFKKNPGKYPEYLSSYIDLLQRLSVTKTYNEAIPSARPDLLHRLELVKGAVNSKLYEEIEKRVLSLPDEDTLVHGDCHFKNVFLGQDGLMLIDMDTLCKGNPLLEIANLHRTYVAFETVDPGNVVKFFEIGPDFTRKLFLDLYHALIGNEEETKDTMNKIEFLSYFLLLSHYAEKKEKYAELLTRTVEVVESLLPKVDSLK